MDRTVPPARGAGLSAVPWLATVLAAGLFVVWIRAPVRTPMSARVPGTDRPATDRATPEGGAGGDVFAKGLLIAGPGKPADLPGTWPRFRGPNLDGISPESTRLARTWPGGKPKELWSINVGEGYAGPAIAHGQVYLMDYDREHQRDALRCLSLADGAEIWRFSYPVSVKRNHGLTRTVPAVAGETVIAIGPKCHVVAVEARSGRFRWGLDLVKDFGTTVPAWYAGQCPLVDGDQLVLAPAGPEALLLGVDPATGKVRWQTPNAHDWKMTHSSVVPWDLGGRRYYFYCGSGGVAMVSATNGAVAWETTAWKINIATVPSPVPLDGGRVFFTGGYGAGSVIFEFGLQGERVTAREVVRLKADVFGATQHSPIWYQGHLYGIRADGRLVCLSGEGKVVWASGPETNFGLGPILVADGLVLALNDAAVLTAAEAKPTGYAPLASASLFEGTEAWAPLALAGGRLLARDMNRMVCVQLGP